MIGWVAFLLQAAAPPPPPPPAVAFQPATEAEVWALARRVNRPGGYRVYLHRFLQGGHADEARHRLEEVSGLLGTAPPGSHAMLVPPPAQLPPAPAAPSRCPELAWSSAEAEAMRAARLSNRPADFQAYLARYPDGWCRAEAEAVLRYRADRSSVYAIIVPGLGPLPPQRMRPIQAVLADADYPPSAIRAEQQGRVVAEWEVAEDGVPESCRVVESSGSQALDAATCRIFTVRMRYDPARDASGRAVRAKDSAPIRWVLPIDEPPAPSPPQPAAPRG